MKSAVVYLSTRCPECGRETKIPYTRLEIADLLCSSNAFRMYSACHNVSWTATEEDRRLLFALIKPGDVVTDLESSETPRQAAGIGTAETGLPHPHPPAG